MSWRWKTKVYYATQGKLETETLVSKPCQISPTTQIPYSSSKSLGMVLFLDQAPYLNYIKWEGRSRGKLFLNLLVFNCLQLKMISMPIWQILGILVLNPYTYQTIKAFSGTPIILEEWSQAKVLLNYAPNCKIPLNSTQLLGLS